MNLFSTSGGLRYHARALMSRALWRPFAQDIDSWLRTWDIDEAHLILIGPSAGYSLPKTWVKKFRVVTAFDLDPLAPFLFSRRHGRGTAFSRQDLFFSGSALSLAPLRRCLKENPTAALLFCNVLGQIPIGKNLAEEEWLEFLAQLRELLTGRRWASYHDIYTLDPFPLARHASALDEFRQTPDVTRQTGWGEVLDHGTYSAWSEGLNKNFFGWSLTRRSFHLIEGLRV